MWKVKKIVETIITFIVVMLLICFVVSLGSLSNTKFSLGALLSKTGLYFLYSIGYGALEGEEVLQNILALIGIVGLALMSTYLTINLFWRMDDVLLSKKIIYEDGKLKFQFNNKGRTICDIKINFMLYDNEIKRNIMSSEELSIPIVMKKSKFETFGNIEETFWYQTVYELLKEENKKLYCVYSFVDTRSGQSSIKVEDFDKSAIINQGNILTYAEFTKAVVISNNKLLPVKNGGTIELEQKEKFRVLKYKFKNKNSGFVMVYYDFKGKFLNLGKYNKNLKYLYFVIKSKKDALVTLEIKGKDGEMVSLPVKAGKEKLDYKISLKDIDVPVVKEICFTVFSKDNILTNEIEISNLEIREIE